MGLQSQARQAARWAELVQRRRTSIRRRAQTSQRDAKADRRVRADRRCDDALVARRFDRAFGIAEQRRHRLRRRGPPQWESVSRELVLERRHDGSAVAHWNAVEVRHMDGVARLLEAHEVAERGSDSQRGVGRERLRRARTKRGTSARTNSPRVSECGVAPAKQPWPDDGSKAWS